VRVVKVQPPLDNSDDAKGGIGRMIPTTLLLHDASGQWVHFVQESDRGHTALLRAALRHREQVAYLYARFEGSQVEVFTDPDVFPDPRPDW